MSTREVNPPQGMTPCKENPDVFSTPLLDSFDSVAFAEDHPELSGKSLKKAQDIAEASHDILHKQAVAEAIAMCKSCPILRECGEWALGFETQHGAIYGVVGGMEPSQRNRVRRRMERQRKARAESAKMRAAQADA